MVLRHSLEQQVLRLWLVPRQELVSLHPLACLACNKYHMILNELYHRSPEAYQDVSQDNSQPRLHNLRKTRLTLRQISKLRQMNDVRNYEYKEKLKDIRKQYAPPAAPPAL